MGRRKHLWARQSRLMVSGAWNLILRLGYYYPSSKASVIEYLYGQKDRMGKNAPLYGLDRRRCLHISTVTTTKTN